MGHLRNAWHQVSETLKGTYWFGILLLTTFLLLARREDAPLPSSSGGEAVSLGFLLLFVILGSRSVRRFLTAKDSLPRFLAVQVLVLVEVSYNYFALGMYGQISGIKTGLDALYYAVTVVATVGFGDIHASGQFGRATTTVQMLYDLVVIGIIVNAITSRGGRPQGPAGATGTKT